MSAKRSKGSCSLHLDVIRLDFQPAENLIEETVQMYVESLKCGQTLPLLSVRFDGSNYFLEDGFHRLEAAKRCGVETLRAEIFDGTLAEMEGDFQDYLKQLRDNLRP
jgi:hypothetical protein